MTGGAMAKRQRQPSPVHHQIISGGLAGFVEVCLLYPLDMVKTRFQFSAQRRSVVPYMLEVAKTEGPLALYKGMLPPVLAETPKRAVKFMTFSIFDKALKSPDGRSTPTGLFVAGLGSGLVEGIIINPFEVVKVHMLANTNRVGSTGSMTTWQATQKIIAEKGYGLTGLNKGLTATLLRHGIFNCVYFGVYHNIEPLSPLKKSDSKKSIQIANQLACGFVAGCAAATANIPFDVAKSRIQSPQEGPEVKYRSTAQTIRLVYREEGLAALYRGLVPKVMRLGPGGAIMLMVVAQSNQLLRELGY